MLLRDIIGQEKLKHQLVEMVQHQRLSHALLFVGPEGSGALPLAIAFAQYLVCSPATTNQVLDMFADPDALAKQVHTFNEPDAIADLPAYQRANQLMHPDLHFSFPTITEKPGQKNISANFIEQWREFVQGYPYGNVFDWFNSSKQKINKVILVRTSVQKLLKN